MKKISMAVIGLGCRGKGLHGTLLSMEDVEVVALCDEYQDRVDAAVNDNEIITGKRPFGTTDYRQVLAMPEVDAVLIGASYSDCNRCNASREGVLHGGWRRIFP